MSLVIDAHDVVNASAMPWDTDHCRNRSASVLRRQYASERAHAVTTVEYHLFTPISGNSFVSRVMDGVAHVQLGIRPGVLSILNEAVPAIARLHAGFALRIEGDAAHCPAVALRKEEGQARVLPLYSVALSKDRRSLRDQRVVH